MLMQPRTLVQHRPDVPKGLVGPVLALPPQHVLRNHYREHQDQIALSGLACTARC